MIYFFHHYELPVILQQAQIQDILMRNQQDGGPPLRLTQVISRVFIYVIFIRILWFHEFFFQRTAAALINNNNTAEANNNNSNGGPREVARAAGFNFAGFRFRFGVVLTTHQTHRHLRQHQHNNQQDRQVISRVFFKCHWNVF